MKILLGGIPLGCDNIGDEAIIAAVVKMLKGSIPGVELTVATKAPATAGLLGVETVPPYGFADVPQDGFVEAVSRHDAYVWCGATGLSDYPNVALDLLEKALDAGVPSFVWGVGMDDELNPVFFKAHGKKRFLLMATGLLGLYERRLRARLASRMASILPRCTGVWLRDPQSVAMLASTGFAGADVAADSAILLENGPDVRHATSDTHFATSVSRPTLGLCISTQRQVSDLAGLKRLIEKVRKSGANVLGIPMNPKTDRALLEKLGVECIPGTTPEAVMEAASKCSVVLSSRLHLLILAANAGTRGLGIARGSKLANWLSNFGATVEGSVYDCDWDKVAAKVLSALGGDASWNAVRDSAYSALTARLERARADFTRRLLGIAPDSWPRVSVLVRAHNDEKLIDRTLKGIFAQYPPPFEVIVCDDASTDRTREIAAKFPVKFFERPAGPYKPGRTLNALVREAKGDIVVFNNSDSVPLDPHWLAELVKPLAGGDHRYPPAVGCPQRGCPSRGAPRIFTFANQLPRPDAQALVRKDNSRAFGDGKVQATWRFFFSLASSATWRQNLVDVPFDEEIQYSEDVEWAWRNSRREKDPVRIVYCQDARVEHSHNYTLRELAKRFKGEGVADRAIYGEKPSLLRELFSAGRETLRDWAYLLPRPRNWREIPSAPLRRLVQRISHWRGTKSDVGSAK